MSGVAAGSIHGFLVTITVDDKPPESIIVNIFWDGKAWRHDYFNYAQDGFYGKLEPSTEEYSLAWVDPLLADIASSVNDDNAGCKKVTVNLDMSVHTRNWEGGPFARGIVFNFS